MPEKILINLFSEQRLPNFIAVLHELPDLVIALTTSDFRSESDRFEEVTGTPHEEVSFDPYALTEDLAAFRRVLERFPQETEVVINFTGGTKIMAVAAVLGTISEAQSRSFRLMYLDTGRSEFESIQIGSERRMSPPEKIPVTLTIPLKAYFVLRGEKLVSCVQQVSDPMRDRLNVAQALLKEECDGFFWKQNELFSRDEFKRSGSIMFNSKKRSSREPIGNGSLIWGKTQAEFTTSRGKQYVVDGSDCAAFFAGGWLEEFCFMKLLGSGRFDEVLLNVTLDLREETKKRMRAKEKLKNEIDIVVCKGLRAALVECKAGRVTQDHVYKLAALRDHLLGSFGVGVIVARVPLDESVREKAEDLKIEIVMGDRISRLTSKLEKLLEKK